MTQSSLTVIKVGGSLFDWPDLRRRMIDFLAGRKAIDRDERMVMIAGGGEAADLIRAIDLIHHLGETSAHWPALHAMDLTANILATILPQAVAVDQIGSLDAAWSAGLTPVLAPRLTLEDIERSGAGGLPATWDVTSDTIAAWLAAHMGADRLILLKSAPLPVGIDLDGAARLGLVDPMLPVVARAIRRVEYIDLRDSASSPQPLA